MIVITEELLKKMLPKASAEKIKTYSLAFSKVFPSFEINTPRRIASFIGQIAVESGELKYDKELPSKYNKKDPKDASEPTGTLYEGRKNLGNYVAGDGPKFIGRGILQLTGRDNYNKYGMKLKLDLVGNPERACEPEISTMIACQYFKDRELNKYADLWNLAEVTKRVNGTGMLHHDKRVEYAERALKILEGKDA
jgi:putative chitinase